MEFVHLSLSGCRNIDGEEEFPMGTSHTKLITACSLLSPETRSNLA